MIRRPPRSTRVRSSAASDVYKRQMLFHELWRYNDDNLAIALHHGSLDVGPPVSYTHLRAHETPEHKVCRRLLENKKKKGRERDDTIAHHQQARRNRTERSAG